MEQSISLSIKETISELGKAEATSHTIELVNDPDTDVQLAAIRQAAEQALHGLEVAEAPFSFRVS